MGFTESAIAAWSANAFCIIIYVSLSTLLLRFFYRIYFHPLSHVPGPFLPKVSSLWLYYHTYIGDEASIIDAVHDRYGAIVRIAPNETDVSDADAINSIYISKGGFLKPPIYANFDIDGHKTIFSTSDPAYRSPRAKAVTPLFSTKNIRDSEKEIAMCVARFQEKLKEYKETKKGEPVNLLNLTRSLAVDVVSTHLFQQNYHGLSEGTKRLSVSAFVDAYVGVGRFFYLPNVVFSWLDWTITKCLPHDETTESMATVDAFVNKLVSTTKKGSLSYAGRLLDAGFTKGEVMTQCKDLMFAGTDSTAMNLACIMRYLVLYPDKYRTLQDEIQQFWSKFDMEQNATWEVQALPYLNAVVKEGLRLGMANPTRLPRVVPAAGWTFKDTFFPAGTIVGCAAYSLHFNPSIFPDPRVFKPERWLEDNVTLEMTQSWFAFGAGSRACIARNLAMIELLMATEKIAHGGIMEGATVVSKGEVQIYEWFNSRVKGEKIEITWDMKE